MKRILIGLIALVVITAGGWFGFNAYVQHRATAEVDAAFEQLRSGGNKASHGKVAFDLSTRTLTIADITVERAAQPPATVQIAGIKAVGVSQVDDNKVSADSIEVSDTQFTFESAAGATNLKAAYKAPQIIVRDFSGPVRTQGAPASEALADLYRFAIDQFVGVTASSVVAPTIAISINPGSSGPGSGEIAYSGLAIEKIRNGRFDAAKMDRATFAINVQQPGRPDKLTGELVNMIVNDFDANAVAAVLDPQKISDETFHRVYRQISTGTYVVTSTQGVGRLRAIKYGEGELALEGLDAPSPQGQVKMERFAVKSFSTGNLMRWAAQFANLTQTPTPDQVLGLFRVLEGAEI
ncbi:MAG: hypothetical protein ABUL53_00350, partial [Bradyrhizobium guangdongense]